MVRLTRFLSGAIVPLLMWLLVINVLLVNEIRRVFVGAIIRILGVHVFVVYSFGL